ncbi:hypothetical protein [Shewanella sp. 6_MG-2023]|uniref:RCC1 domain-containing protein n=1 Tax=Shewanella sp. 6_MG-2023 TaxID=3062660 RepID=UPI0026E11F38|nr:hypothetical protein [Shewanella sp. 6_MG-2023]MDO6617638.1 hypothetical protein [Shewanella sp. 6_MG-2023]
MNRKSALVSMALGAIFALPQTASASSIKTFQDISTSTYHSVAVTTDGQLYGWGTNAHSRFGTEGMDEYAYKVPTLLASELDVVWTKAFANSSGVVALTDDGKLMSWGKNANCQTGQGETDTSLTLTPAYLDIETDSPFIAITGSNFTYSIGSAFALTESGELWAWGNNTYGRLGNASNEQQCSPVKVSSEQKFSAISVSNTHTLAIDDAGEIWGWGRNSNDQYNNIDDDYESNIPVNTQTNKQWKTVAAGDKFSFAIDIQGVLYVRGVADNLVSGIADETQFSDWTLVDDNQEWDEIKVAPNHVIAKDSSGNLWTWGYSSSGLLGLGSGIKSVSAPTKIPSQNSWLTVAMDDKRSFAIRTDNTLWAWGSNVFDALGDGGDSSQYLPVSLYHQVTNKAVTVSAGYEHFMLIDAQGQLWGGQSQRSGRIGNGKNTSSRAVSPIPISSKVWSQVASGGDFTVAIDAKGKLWGWGENGDKILANTSDSYFTRPIKLSDKDWQFVSAGMSHFAAIATDGSLWLAGDNYYGQLGTGDQVDTNGLTQLGTDTDWREVSATQATTIALKNDGSLWGWGYNEGGQLGLGYVNEYESAPMALNLGNDWKTLSQGASGWQTLAVKSDGSLWGWGYNRYGQLGLSHTDIAVTVPTRIGTKNDWGSAVVGWHYSLALKQDGRLYGLGRNEHSQLGDGAGGTDDLILKPKYISEGWKSIAATEEFSVGIKDNNDVYTWGKLALPGASSSNTPIQNSYADSDADGIADLADAFPYDASEYMDFDFDGIGDNADLDDDNDGFDDVYELSNGSSPWSVDSQTDDIDNDGYPLAVEYLAGTFDNAAESIPSPQASKLYSFEQAAHLQSFNLHGWALEPVDDARVGVALASQTKVDNAEDIVSITAAFNSGVVAYSVKVSTESFDEFYVEIDGEVVDSTVLSGEHGWQVVLVDIEAGEHTLSWHYLKDDETAELEDTVWLTDIVLPLNLDVLDSDFDGMPDGWEYTYDLNPFLKTDASDDIDQDGLTNLEEYIANANPLIADTDGDGLPDGYEVEMGLDPTSAADGLLDNDSDGLTNLEEYLQNTNPFDSDSDGDGVSDYDEVASGSDPLDQNIIVGVPNLLVAVNDANGDRVNDWVKYTLTDNSVDISLLSGVDNTEIANFSIVHSYDDVSVSILADRNNDNVEEIGVFGFDAAANRYQLVVHDVTSGSKFGAWNWPATLGEVSFEALTDLTQDGIQEYAISGVHLGNGTRQLVVKDGSTKAAYQTFKWPNLWDRLSFVTMTDVSADGVPEVALYGRHTRLDKGQLFIYDGADANSKVDVYNWNKLWNDIQLVEMDDIDGDGTIDWGQFGQRKDDGRYQWLVKKGHDKRGVIRTFSWPNDLVDVQPMLVGDRTQDGIREVAVVGTNPNTGKVFLRINDGALANERIANISWPGNWEDIQVNELGDLNNDGFNEYGLLGYTKTNRSVQLIVKDGKALTEYGRYTLTGRWEGLSLSHDDINQDGVMDIIIEGINQSTKLRTITVLDGSDLLEISSSAIN